MSNAHNQVQDYCSFFSIIKKSKKQHAVTHKPNEQLFSTNRGTLTSCAFVLSKTQQLSTEVSSSDVTRLMSNICSDRLRLPAATSFPCCNNRQCVKHKKSVPQKIKRQYYFLARDVFLKTNHAMMSVRLSVWDGRTLRSYGAF